MDHFSSVVDTGVSKPFKIWIDVSDKDINIQHYLKIPSHGISLKLSKKSYRTHNQKNHNARKHKSIYLPHASGVIRLHY